MSSILGSPFVPPTIVTSKECLLGIQYEDFGIGLEFFQNAYESLSARKSPRGTIPIIKWDDLLEEARSIQEDTVVLEQPMFPVTRLRKLRNLLSRIFKRKN